jgi:hypothetical protein
MLSFSKNVKFDCAACGHTLSAPKQIGGAILSCDACGAINVVPKKSRPRLMVSLSLDESTACFEDYAAPPTERQIALLQKLGEPVPPSQDEASDALDKILRPINVALSACFGYFEILDHANVRKVQIALKHSNLYSQLPAHWKLVPEDLKAQVIELVRATLKPETFAKLTIAKRRARKPKPPNVPQQPEGGGPLGGGVNRQA